MSINITFEGLCAFFTKNLLLDHRLVVGLIEVSDSNLPLTEFHIPRIEITDKSSKEIVEYTGISGRRCLKGEVFLHLILKNEILAPDLISKLGADNNATLLDIEKDLYPHVSLSTNPQKCRALLYINNGVLSQNGIQEFDPSDLEYHELKPDGTSSRLPDVSVSRKLLYSAKIVIDLPKNSYAVLHFAEGADDFVFKADREYQVTATSFSQASTVPETIEINHFQYYYKLVGNIPNKIIVPELTPGGQNGNPYCMNGGFGNSP